jgi:hypothetical protein
LFVVLVTVSVLFLSITSRNSSKSQHQDSGNLNRDHDRIQQVSNQQIPTSATSSSDDDTTITVTMTKVQYAAFQQFLYDSNLPSLSSKPPNVHIDHIEAHVFSPEFRSLMVDVFSTLTIVTIAIVLGFIYPLSLLVIIPFAIIQVAEMSETMLLIVVCISFPIIIAIITTGCWDATTRLIWPLPPRESTTFLMKPQAPSASTKSE